LDKDRSTLLRIRIRKIRGFWGFPDPDPSTSKKTGKPFISAVLLFLNNLLSLKTGVNEPSKSKKAKKKIGKIITYFLLAS
jgi:hypothetical protein